MSLVNSIAATYNEKDNSKMYAIDGNREYF